MERDCPASPFLNLKMKILGLLNQAADEKGVLFSFWAPSIRSSPMNSLHDIPSVNKLQILKKNCNFSLVSTSICMGRK
jgi:hypothetical protein